MDLRRIGQAGLVGFGGRLGRRAAEWVGARTRIDTGTLLALAGAVLFVLRTRKMVQMLRRLRRR